jgi:hypothetical protein
LIRFGVSVSIAVAAILAGVRAYRSSLGENALGALLGVLLVTAVRAQPHPLEPG